MRGTRIGDTPGHRDTGHRDNWDTRNLDLDQGQTGQRGHPQSRLRPRPRPKGRPGWSTLMGFSRKRRRIRVRAGSNHALRACKTARKQQGYRQAPNQVKSATTGTPIIPTSIEATTERWPSMIHPDGFQQRMSANLHPRGFTARKPKG